MIFNATEFYRDTARQTGTVETYTASTVQDAIDAFCYTRRLSNGNFKPEYGPTRRVLYVGDRGWTFTRG